jgi:hypothetical protein
MWRARFGRGFGPVVRQTTGWMNEWITKVYHNARFKKRKISLESYCHMASQKKNHKTLKSISRLQKGCQWTYPEPFEQIPHPCTLFLAAVLLHAYLYPPVCPLFRLDNYSLLCISLIPYCTAHMPQVSPHSVVFFIVFFPVFLLLSTLLKLYRRIWD